MTRSSQVLKPARLAAVLAAWAVLAGPLAPPLRAQSPPAAEPAGYQVERDLPYRLGAGLTDYERRRCRLDVYHPAHATGCATVVWFHGGGLTSQERFLPEALKGKGLVIVAANYRLSPQVKAPAYIEDAAAAVAWVFANIERFGGSPDRIFVSGHSAGAYLALMAVLDKHYLAAHGIDANRIAGLVPLSPNVITHFTIRSERGIPPTQPVIDDLAPLFHVRADAPPRPCPRRRRPPVRRHPHPD